MKKLLFIVALLSNIQVLIAQPAIQNLYFNSAVNITRLNFATEPPTVIPTGIPDAGGVAEGIAHYEDQDGNVIFWVNSNGVYNQNGALMSGASGILTNSSAAEICVCPKPEDDNKYYIFYNTETCSALRYSIVDMSLNGGLGNVTNLNAVIDNASFGEGLEVIRIPGTCEYWLVGYQCGTGFKRFRIDSGGITPGTIIQNYATPAGYDGRGELDFHRNKIGCAFAFSNTVFVSDFDAIAGTITNPTTINNAAFNNAPYGLEFSPDASKMYFTLWYSGFVTNDIYQYDFATQTYTGYNAPGSSNLGHIEMGSDGKLYIVHDTSPGITVINNPNDPVPTFSTINTANALGLGISDFIQSDIFNTGIFQGDTTCRTVGNSVVLTTNNSSLTYNWIDSFTGEILFTGSQYSFTMPTDPVNLFVVRNDAPGCSDTLRYLINPNPDIDAGPDLTIELGESIQIQSTAEVNASYIWFPDAGLDNPFTLSPIASPTSTTTYFVAAVVDQCQGSDMMTITVVDNNTQTDTLCVPVGNQTTLSLPDSLLNITWATLDNPSNTLSTNANFAVTATPTVTTYIGKGDNPTILGSYQVQIMVIATPNLDAGLGSTIVNGTSVQLNASGGGGNGYVWTPAASLDNANLPNPTATPTTTTTYYLSSNNNPYCPATDSVTITVINITNGQIDSLCANVGAQQTLNVSSGNFSSIVWADAAQPTNNLGSGASFTFTVPNQDAIYVAKATDASGNITNFYFKIFANPQVNAGSDVTVNEGSIVQLNASNGSNYAWTPAASLDNANIANPTTIALYETTDFSVQNTTNNGCTSTDAVVITVKSESIVLVPNAFSPNNDQTNDVLRITTFNITDLLAFEVYNRWGQKVFETTNLTDGWDGKFKGTEQEMGVYVYQIRVRAKDGTEYDYKGNFTLFR
jgi:gliding motility-associated-like protein